MTSLHAPATPHRSRAGLVALLLATALSGTGCSSSVDRTVATSAIPADYHERHPVALVNARQSLDIFLLGREGQLDYRQKHDVAAFSADYRAHGEGLIQALVPRGSTNPQATEATLLAIRRALAASGLKGDIEVGSYVAADPKLAAVVRLSFVKLQARAASRCGEWPSDLASGSSLEGWENRSYYNLGCATQQTLAAQMDDPRDLVRPRADDPSDVQLRTRGIQDLRGTPGAPVGFDPSTAWGTHVISSTSSISGN